MVSGTGQDETGETNINVNLRNLPGHKSQSAISIPTTYQYYANNAGNPGEGGNSGGAYFVPTPFGLASSSGVGSRGTLPHPSRSGRSVGPGYYHRTLSSSSLLTNKSSVAKSRSDYSSVGVGPSAFSPPPPPPPSNFRRGVYHHPISGSSSNIIYIDNNVDEDPSPPFWGHYGGPSLRERERELARERERSRLIRDSSQPIIINVPITAPKATATTLSRATSPPPPSFGLQGGGGSPKKSSQERKRSCGVDGRVVSSRGVASRFPQFPHHHPHHHEEEEEFGGKRRREESEGRKSTGTNTGSVDEKEEEEGKGVLLERRVAGIPPPPGLRKYWRNAPLKRLKHPLEENIFSSLVITLVAVGVALVFGIPVLCLTGGALVLATTVRYLLYVVYGCYSYLRFFCSTRRSSSLQSTSGGSSSHHHHPVLHHESPPKILPRDRLAFANDVRWLGKKKARRCQSILHTLLVFEGTMDLPSLRHLVQTRVLHAETPEGELAYPRLLHKIVSLPSGFQWHLDVTFDIGNHVFLGPSHVRSESQLQEYLGRLLTESLPVGKPLWEIRVLTNYGPQRDTVAILRVHQCLADGMSLVRILSHSLADHSQMHIPVRPHFAGLSFSFNFIRSLIVGPLTFFMWVLATFRDCSLFTVPLRRKKGAGHKAPRGKKTSERTDEREEANGEADSEGLESSDQSEGGQRFVGTEDGGGERKWRKAKRKARRVERSSSWNVVWSAPVALPKVGRIKQIMRSSLNDVLLSCAAGAIRMYLQQQGIPFPDDVKAVIPVDLRNDIASPKTSTKLGCKIASVLATIPSGIESAIPRLWATRHRLDELKASADPVVAYEATTVLMNVFPHQVGVKALESITDKASVQFSNLPGPTHTLLVGGILLKGIYPIYPPSGKIRVAISFFTYADQIYLTIVSHRSLHNAGPALIEGISAQVDQLAKQLSHRRVPGESRRSTRNASVCNSEKTKPPTRQIHMQLQVVQEELQQLSHQLDTRDDGDLVPSVVPPFTSVISEDFRSSEESLEGNMASLSPAGQAHLRTRLKTLKNEFNELIGELRRRSSIVEGVPMSFEDEESEEDFRKPRKRALSVVSVTRRNSLFAAKGVSTPESSAVYSSDEEMTSSPSHDVRLYNPGGSTPGPSANLRHSSSPIRTTAV